MKKLILFLLVAMPMCMTAQTYTTKYSKAEQKKACKWARKGSWRNGFTKAKPDKTVNLVDFQQQVERNPEQWNALFAWLQGNDLTALKAGKHPIPGTNMVASIQDDSNQPLEKRRTESHRKKVDFQYVVAGIEGFALLDHESSPANCEYDAVKDVIHYDYNKDKTHFITNTKGRFNIFFPGDWHIAKVQTRKKDQKFRVIVVKVDYKD